MRINFGAGFNVLTGETGAGKSIVIDALNSLAGGKIDPIMLSQETFLEGTFDISSSPGIKSLLEEAGLPSEDFLIISRDFSGGRGIARVMGRIVPLQFLSRLGDLLLDIHGQHEHQSLLKQPYHLELLDSWGSGIIEQRKKVGELFSKLQRRKREYEEISERMKERERLLSLYEFQLKEINEAKLVPGEEEELKKEALLLSNAEKIYQNLSFAFSLLKGKEPSVEDLLGRVEVLIEEVAGYDERLKELLDLMREAYSLIEEGATMLGSYVSDIEFNPQRLEEVESRLYLISRLKQKYGGSIEEILAYRDKIEREMLSLSEGEERLEGLKREIEELEGELEREAKKLSQMRRECASYLEEMVVKHLRDLGMEKARFKVSISEKEMDSKGMDRVEFLFSANPGQPLLPLQRIASGGELSRFMLAAKSALREADPVPILVFDEIDQGVGGEMGFVLGEKLRQLSRGRQVIVVTHLPQIACFADYHFLVKKLESTLHTEVKIEKLDREGRVEELTRMLGGSESAPTAYRHAEELLERYGSSEVGDKGHSEN
ncbi:DNA repair protein RecN [bacterium]|nr:DNA repair protein RecN [bacterium]